MTFFPKTVTADRTPTRKDGEIEFAPVSLPGHLLAEGKAMEPAKCSVQLMSMTISRFPNGAAYGGEQPPDYGKPILTIEEAAMMLGVSRKRFENIICEEKARLGHVPDFVCNAGGKIQRRVLRDSLIEWMRARPAKRGRPSKRLT